MRDVRVKTGHKHAAMTNGQSGNAEEPCEKHICLKRIIWRTSNVHVIEGYYLLSSAVPKPIITALNYLARQIFSSSMPKNNTPKNRAKELNGYRHDNARRETPLA